MLIGFSISPTVLKSQSIQNALPLSSFASSNTICSLNFINWFNLISLISDSTDLMKIECVEEDSYNLNTNFSKNKNSSQDNINSNQATDKKIKRKSYRNMAVTIQTRI